MTVTTSSTDEPSQFDASLQHIALLSYWRAYPCQDREHTYQVEERLLKEHKPRLNRKVAR